MRPSTLHLAPTRTTKRLEPTSLAGTMSPNTPEPSLRSSTLLGQPGSSRQVSIFPFSHFYPRRREVQPPQRPLERRKIRPFPQQVSRKAHLHGGPETVFHRPHFQTCLQYFSYHSAPGPGSYRPPSDFGHYDSKKERYSRLAKSQMIKAAGKIDNSGQTGLTTDRS